MQKNKDGLDDLIMPGPVTRAQEDAIRRYIHQIKKEYVALAIECERLQQECKYWRGLFKEALDDGWLPQDIPVIIREDQPPEGE